MVQVFSSPGTVKRIIRVSNPGNNNDIQPLIQAAVNSANLGDEIFLPKGTFILNSTVTINKFISIRGAGIGQTVLYRSESVSDSQLEFWESMFLLDINSDDSSKISIKGITFKSKYPSIDGADSGSMAADKGIKIVNCVDFIVSECRFEYFGHSGIYVLHKDTLSKGLIFKNEFYHNVKSEKNVALPGLGLGYSVSVFGQNTQWVTTPNFGTSNFIFIEDNIFDIGRHAIAAGGCAKYVARYNLITNFLIAQAVDAHEAQEIVGLNYYATRAVEIYNNTIVNTTFKDGTPLPSSNLINRDSRNMSNNGIIIRGGEAVIHDNIISGFRMGVGITDFVHTGTTTYPIPYQIGYNSAVSQGSSHSGTNLPQGDGDLFIWNNSISVPKDLDRATADIYNYDLTKWTEGRDYHKVSKPGYTSYTYPHPNRNVDMRKIDVSDLVTFIPEAIAVFNAMPIKPTLTEKIKYNYAIKNYLVDTNTWAELDELWIPYVGTGLGSGAALINWKHPGTRDLVPMNYGTTPYTNFIEKSGFTGIFANSTYLKTGFIPSTHGIKYTKDSASFGVYLKNNIQDGSNVPLGVWDGVNFSLVRGRNASDGVAGYINETSGTFTSSSDSSQLMSVIRTSATTTQLYRNTTLLTNGTSSSTALPTKEFYIGARNSNGSASLFSNNTVQMAYIGSKLVNLTNLYNFINYLITNLA